MKKFNQFLLLLASALLLLHSFVPHEHHSDMAHSEHQQQHREANSLLEWLQLAFHADLAPNHLQEIPQLPETHWEQQQEQRVQLPALQDSPKLDIFAVPPQRTALFAPASPLRSCFSTFPPPLRAPPAKA